MNVKVSEVLDALRIDHRNMSILLGLMDAEIDKVSHNQNPDFELLHDIMQYMTIYADAIHHPREDIVYDEMRSRGEAWSEGLDGIGPDHADIAVLSMQLRDDLDAIISGTAVQRERVIADASEYARRLRNHMQWEEKELFERADRMCEQAEDPAVEVSHLAANDPVFGSSPDSPFPKLLRRVREEAEAAS